MSPGTERFRVLHELGAGGMGVVYAAEDRERGHLVALKTLRRPDPQLLFALKREFRALAGLCHPNLVTLHDLVIDEAQCFFTMELLEGQTFLEHCRRPEAEAARDQTSDPQRRVLACDEARLRASLRQLALGVHALHEAGKLHRDIKPGNVLVTREGRVVLLDFGLTVDLAAPERATGPGRGVGTVDYMSPEQASGEARLAPASDWYAVGTMLYQSLTGRLPFQGTEAEVTQQRLAHPAPPPRAVLYQVPEDLDALCAALLARAPERRPSGREVLRRLGIGGAASVVAPESQGPGPASAFQGRRRELEQLEAAVAGTTQGQASAVLLLGPSGMGKTTLARELLGRVGRRHPNLVVLQGRCYERENIPYKAMDALIDDLSEHWLSLSREEAAELLPRRAWLLPRLFPVLERVPAVAGSPRGIVPPDPAEVRTQAFAALRELLQRATERFRIVLFLDDLQWVDADTVTLLVDLMRPPDPPALLLLLAARQEGSAGLERLLGGMGVVSSTVRVGPLDEADALRLAELLLGEGASSAAARLVKEAEGSPFFVRELSDHVAAVGEARLGEVSLDRVLRDRIGRLGGAAPRALELIATAGEPIAEAVLAAAAGLDRPALARELALLRAQRLVRGASGSPGRVEPYHDRIREAVLADLGARRPELHRALATALSASGQASAGQLARHWHAAGDVARAAEHAQRAAAGALATMDFALAARFFGIALEGGVHRAEERPRALAELGEALANAGQPADAASAFLEAAASTEAAARLELQRRGAEQLVRGGYLERGLAALRAVLAGIGLRLASTPAAALRSMLLRRAWLRLRGLRFRSRHASEIAPRRLARVDVCWSVASSLAVIDNIRGADYQARHLVAALRCGEPHRVARALAIEASFLAVQGAGGRARDVLARVAAVGTASEGAYVVALARFAAGYIDYFTANRWRVALGHFTDAEAAFGAHVQAGGWETDTAQLYACVSLLYLGELAELGRRVPAYLRAAERRGDRYAGVTLRTRLGLLWLARDDAAGAARDLEEAMREWQPAGASFQVQHFFALLGACEHLLYQGRADEAAARLLADGPALRRSLLLHLPVVRLEVTHLEGRVALSQAARLPAGSPERARRLRAARDRARRLSRAGPPLAGGLSRLLEAGVAGLSGNRDAALARLREAITRLDELETGLYTMPARWCLGQVLGADEGKQLVEQARLQMRAQGIASPERLSALLAPGCAAS